MDETKLNGNVTDLSSALDLSTKGDEQMSMDLLEKGKISSPVLMPPPKNSNVFKPIAQVPIQKLQVDTSKPVSNTVCETNSSYFDNNTLNSSPEVEQKLNTIRCLVPTNDVKCFLSTNIKTDLAMKKKLYYQISRKIYNKPAIPEKKSPEKRSEDKLRTPVTESVQAHEQPMPFTFNSQHFSSKKMEIDDLDVAVLGRPMRSSTPTPSVGGTILAGHLDYYAEHEADISKDLKIHDNTTSKPTENKNMEPKLKYCNEWMHNEKGVSSTNIDKPPSLYEPSVQLSDSLLDITSIS